MNLIEPRPVISLRPSDHEPCAEAPAVVDHLSDLEFTGERMIPGLVEFHLEAEHRARYEFAGRNLPKGLVLDDGCGVGYGSAVLACHGLRVVGIDVDAKAIAACRQNALPSITFQQEDSANLSFSDGHFDGVVSFEVIEHVTDYRRYVAEAHRVLRPGGVFIISTPNKRVYTDIPQHHNPFHVHEFYLDEFRDLLSSFFPDVEVIGQWNAEAIVIGPAADARLALSADFMLRSRPETDAQSDPLEEATYFLAICRKKGTAERPTRAISGHCFVTDLCVASGPPPVAGPATLTDKTKPASYPIGFRQGFYQDEGGWRWMSPAGKLRVPASSTPVQLSFNLTASKLSFYQRRPLRVQIMQDGEPVRNETFSRDNESRRVDLLVPKSVHDVTIEFTSSSFFLPSRCGWPADKRELSVRLGELKVGAPGTMLLKRI
jgi:SAM-dependent methyltransferase